MKITRLKCCSGSSSTSGYSLQRGSIGLSINGMPASLPTGTVLNSLYTSTLNNPEIIFCGVNIRVNARDHGRKYKYHDSFLQPISRSSTFTLYPPPIN
jgi:hypothetical protein